MGIHANQSQQVIPVDIFDLVSMFTHKTKCHFTVECAFLYSVSTDLFQVLSFMFSLKIVLPKRNCILAFK